MIFPYKINIGTVERNDNRYEEDIVIPKAKNVGPNKISVLGKDIRYIQYRYIEFLL